IGQAAEAIGCDPALVALPFLTCLAISIGTTREIRLKHSWREPPILWTAIVADSGGHKTPAFTEATRILNRKQGEAIEQNKLECQRYHHEVLSYEVAVGEWKKTGRKNGEPAPIKPEEPQP